MKILDMGKMNRAVKSLLEKYEQRLQRIMEETMSIKFPEIQDGLRKFIDLVGGNGKGLVGALTTLSNEAVRISKLPSNGKPINPDDKKQLAEIVDACKGTADQYLKVVDRIKQTALNKNFSVVSSDRDTSTEDRVQQLPVETVKNILAKLLDPQPAFSDGPIGNYLISHKVSLDLEQQMEDKAALFKEQNSPWLKAIAGVMDKMAITLENFNREVGHEVNLEKLFDQYTSAPDNKNIRYMADNLPTNKAWAALGVA